MLFGFRLREPLCASAGETAVESRYMVSMQYVASGDMNPFMRFVSNMKDSIAYCGLKEVFFGRRNRA